MSVTDYHVMPRQPGWKYEYFDGQCHVTPSHTIVTGRLELHEPNRNPDNLQIAPIAPEMIDELLEVAFDAFHDTIEYCDWEPHKIRKSLRDELERLFAGTKKQLLNASFAALNGERVIGAALSVQSPIGPELSLFFVTQDWQRRGVGHALLNAMIERLHSDGARDLHVLWAAGNPASDAFYRKQGFEVLPDLFHANHMRNVTHANLAHAEHVGGDVRTAQLELRFWEDQVEALERIQTEQGFDAVTPWKSLHP
jgi:GNAT superfamily N-acetyltransferase